FCTSSDLHIFGNWIINAGTYPPAPGKCEPPGKWCYYYWSSRVCHPAQGEKTLGHFPFPWVASGAAPRHSGILWAQLLFRDGTWRGTSPPDLVTDRFMHMREIITQYVVFHHTDARDQSMTELVPPSEKAVTHVSTSQKNTIRHHTEAHLRRQPQNDHGYEGPS